MEERQIGKRIVDISRLVDIFEAQEGEIQQIIGKTGNGKTYEGTRRALELLKQGQVVYTTWHLVLPEKYDERKKFFPLLLRILFFKKNFYVFDFKKNWKHLDIDRPDLIDFVAGLTDCTVFLDEGQDIFDSYEGRGMSLDKRKTLTRTRHMRKTLIIISQRAQAVAVTARANVTFFYKCVKRFSFGRFVYFKIYRTEEMDSQNFPVWEDLTADWQAPVWASHWGRKEVYDSYNSWYLRAGIPRSQEVSFEAYELNTFEKIVALIKLFSDTIKGKNKEVRTEEIPQKETQWNGKEFIEVKEKRQIDNLAIKWASKRKRKIKIDTIPSPVVSLPICHGLQKKEAKKLKGGFLATKKRGRKNTQEKQEVRYSKNEI